MWALISQRQFTDSHGQCCDLLENAYLTYFFFHGLHVLPVPNIPAHLSDFLHQLPRISGIILSGGNDIDPRTYGEPLNGEELDCVPERDRVEKLLMDFAIEQRLPVLGICRGMQFLNVYFGGKLVRDIPKLLGQPHPAGVSHPIEITESHVADYLKTGSYEVNSYHNQAVSLNTLSSCLRVFALAPGRKIVEGLYHPHYPIAGVQFHPERDPKAEKSVGILIEAFRDQTLFWSRC